MEIFKLFGSVLVETSGAEKGLNNVDKQAKGVTDKIGGYISTATKWMAGVSAAVGTVGAALIAQVNKTAEYGDQIDKQSQRLGFTATEYQEWDHALQHYGTSLGDVGKQIKDLYENVANGKDDTIDALGQIGISLNEASGLSSAELFKRVVTALQGIPDPAIKAAFASILFKGAADKLAPALNDTDENTSALREHMGELNALMSDEAVANAAHYEDAVLDLKTAWSGLGIAIGSWFMPKATAAIEWVTNTAIPALKSAVEWMRQFDVGMWLNSGTTEMEDATSSLIRQGEALRAYENGDITQEQYYSETTRLGSHGGSYASGLDFVPWPEKQVKVHYGETILNKAQADAYRAGNTGGSTVINQYISSVPQTPADLAAATRASFEQVRWLP